MGSGIQPKISFLLTVAIAVTFLMLTYSVYGRLDWLMALATAAVVVAKFGLLPTDANTAADLLPTKIIT